MYFVNQSVVFESQCITTQLSSYFTRTQDRGQKLKEASEQQQFLRAVEDMEQWMSDMETQMASEDLGKNLMSVNILIKKHTVREESMY